MIDLASVRAETSAALSRLEHFGGALQSVTQASLLRGGGEQSLIPLVQDTTRVAHAATSLPVLKIGERVVEHELPLSAKYLSDDVDGLYRLVAGVADRPHDSGLSGTIINNLEQLKRQGTQRVAMGLKRYEILAEIVNHANQISRTGEASATEVGAALKLFSGLTKQDAIHDPDAIAGAMVTLLNARRGTGAQNVVDTFTRFHGDHQFGERMKMVIGEARHKIAPELRAERIASDLAAIKKAALVGS